MKAEFYVSYVGRYFGGIWLGFRELHWIALYVQNCENQGKQKKEEKGCVILFVCLFLKEPLFRRGCGRGPLYEVPVSHSSSKAGIHPSL